MKTDFKEIFGNFNIPQAFLSAEPYGNGHINDTYLVLAGDSRYILQRINKNVFPQPEKVINNIEGVTGHILNKIGGRKEGDERRVLTLVECKNGKKYHVDAEGGYWRVYPFIEDSLSLELPESKEDFYQSAVAFGNFQYMLADYPADTLFETIADFHNTPVRFKNFTEAVEKDCCKRAAGVQREIVFIKEREDFCNILEDSRKNGDLPLKVTHNDTKMNNVLLDKKTRKALCVIDLDTIMPGFSVNDFGDSIRFGASTAAEDEKDLEKVHFDIGLFETYVKGFLEGCAGSLTEKEIQLLPTGAKMMTLECGMRFLADYLQGDIYFKTKYPEHNLDRCRTQLKLVSEMESKWEEMRRIVSAG